MLADNKYDIVSCSHWKVNWALIKKKMGSNVMFCDSYASGFICNVGKSACQRLFSQTNF